MAQMTLAGLKSFVRAWIPDRSESSITVAANHAALELYRRIAPRGRGGITTSAPYTTGTVAVTQGSTTVTLTGGTFATTVVGQVFLADGSDTPFAIDSRTDTTHIELALPWDGETDASTTYGVYFAKVSLPSDCQWLGEIGKVGEQALTRVPDDRVPELLNRQIPGLPTYFEEGPIGTDGTETIILIPPPDDVYAFPFTYWKRLTAMAADGDACGLPPEFDDALQAATLALCWDMEDKPERATFWDRKAYRKFLDVAAHRTGKRRGLRFKAVDETSRPFVINQATPIT